MVRLSAFRKAIVYPSALGAMLLCRSAVPAQDTAKDSSQSAGDVQIVQFPGENPQTPGFPGTSPSATQPPGAQTPGAQPPGSQPPGTGASNLPTTPGLFQSGFSPPSQSGAQAPREAPGGAAVGTQILGGGDSQPRAASDVGDFLGKSSNSTGVEIQRRTPVSSDPRIRGYHVGEVVTYADGGFFFPARQDLDTAVSKIDSNMIRDVRLEKGPYAVNLGPGFAFIDIATNDTPRYEDGYQTHGRTSMGYQTNGQRIDGTQTIWGGSTDWGFRVGYGIRVGNDYHAANGYDVPSSYNSQPINFALGYNFSPDSRLEFKGIHLDQRNVEFPGLYFDINHLTTDAESIRWTVTNQEFFDRFTLDLWYNHTDGNGDTHQGAKQLFLNTFLSQSAFSFVRPPLPGQLVLVNTPGFNSATLFPAPDILRDRSSTNFSEMSRGYRTAVGWGETGCPQLTVGTDLNYVNQRLQENIRYVQNIDNPLDVTNNPPPLPGFPPLTGFQNPGIPASHLVDPGIFAEVTVPLSKRFSIKSGVRGDWVETNSGSRVVTGNIPVLFGPPGSVTPFGTIGSDGRLTSFDPIGLSSQPNNSDLHNDFALWSAFVTADYKIDDHWTALGGFGYSERPPTLTELYASAPYLSVLQQGLDRLYGDPHLKPERLKQMDIGLRADYENFRAGVSGFYAWIDDYITFDVNNFGGNALNQVAQVVYTNTDQAILGGGELFAEAEVTSYLTPFGSLSYVQGRDLTHIDQRRAADLVSSRRTISQEPLSEIPPLEGRVGIRLHEARKNPKYSIELAARMVEAQGLVATSLGELPTPGFTIFDVRAYWQVTDAVLLTAGVENFTDKFYREHLDPLSGFPSDQLFRPGANFYMGVSVQY